VTYFVETEPAATKAASCTPGVWEGIHVPLELPVAPVRSAASIRAGVVTGLCESILARVELPVPIVSKTQLRTSAATIWQESCVTQTVSIVDEVLTVTAQAHGKSAVASTHETAKTHVNLQEVDYGRTE